MTQGVPCPTAVHSAAVHITCSPSLLEPQAWNTATVVFVQVGCRQADRQAGRQAGVMQAGRQTMGAGRHDQNTCQRLSLDASADTTVMPNSCAAGGNIAWCCDD
jgi:hypothetical protein